VQYITKPSIKGAIGITDKLCVKLSPALNGGVLVRKLFNEFESNKIYITSNINNRPSLDMLDWHSKEVFKF
jgi:putative restriction endonuclease